LRSSQETLKYSYGIILRVITKRFAMPFSMVSTFSTVLRCKGVDLAKGDKEILLNKI